MTRDPREVLSRPSPPPPAQVRYGDGADQVADVWAEPGPHPDPKWHGGAVVLFFHGGFWRSEYDRVHVRPLAHALHAAGYRVASIEFARTGVPGGEWPATLDDVRLAVTAVPALLGLAPSDVVLAGHSAGGHLALWAAAELARAGTPPRGVLALAAVSDLAAAYSMDLDGGAAAALVGGGPDRFPDRYRAADPMARLPLGARIALVHGTDDAQVPVDLSRRFAAAAEAAGDEVTYTELVCTEHFGLIDPDSSAWPAVMAALRGVIMPRSR